MVGKGAIVKPCIELIGSAGVTISELVSEGLGGKPQIRLKDCRGIVLENLILGTPDEDTLDSGNGSQVVRPAGEGIHLQNCTFCTIRNWFVHPNKSLWDIDRSRRRIRLNRRTRNCTIDVMIGGSVNDPNRQEDPYKVIKDNGKDNWIKTVNAATFQTVFRYNKRTLPWP